MFVHNMRPNVPHSIVCLEVIGMVGDHKLKGGSWCEWRLPLPSCSLLCGLRIVWRRHACGLEDGYLKVVEEEWTVKFSWSVVETAADELILCEAKVEEVM